MTNIPEYLTSSHPGDVCRNLTCPEAVKRDPETGRYFITMGHAGFNSAANNGKGYVTVNQARAAVRHYLGRGGSAAWDEWDERRELDRLRGL